MHWLKIIIDSVFACSLLINAILFIPQMIRIYKTKSAANISLMTFFGFCITQLAAVLYGYIHHDYFLFYGYMLAFLLCGSTLATAIYYRKYS